MSGESSVPKLLDSKSPQQELKSTIIKSKERNKKPQPEEEINKDTPGRVRLRSDDDTNLSKDKLLNQIFYELAYATEERALVFQTVRSEIAHSTITELDRLAESNGYRLSYDSLLKTLKIVIMPTRIQDCHQPWLISSMGEMLYTRFLTLQEHRNLRISTNTRFETFGPPYTSSRKEPDQCVTPRGMDCPTLVIESGWSESRPQLHHDRDLWLIGGQGSVQVVLVIKWTKNPVKQVKGDIEVFELDPLGNVRSIQQEIIFPTPAANIANAQRIAVSRRQLFGPSLPAGQNPAQVTYLSINDLRDIADEYLRIEGYTPAP